MSAVTRTDRSAAGLPGSPSPARPALPVHPVATTRRGSDTTYRPFFLAAIAITLSLGAGWGAWLLWRIGFAGSFTAVSVHAVNAHGFAQIYGWVALFIVGFAYQFFPRLLHATPTAARGVRTVLGLQVAGLAIATLALDLGAGVAGARAAALAGALLVTAAAALFAVHMRALFAGARGGAGAAWRLFAGAGIGFFVASAAASAFHGWVTMGATTKEALVAAVATWQAPLRDLQVHGMALFMILGVGLKLHPSLLGVPPVPERRARRAFAILLASVIAETLLFLAYRASGAHWVAAFLLLPWIGLLWGAALAVAPLHPLRRPKAADRTNKFLRAAYVWLFVSLVMLVLLPLYTALAKIPFSHAWYGATRHAITVGFVSLMIMGMAARFVAALGLHERRALPSLMGPFLLVNVGCFLRVTLQVATDWTTIAFPVVGISSLLELAGLAWWGAHIAALAWRRPVRTSTAHAGPASP